MKKNFSFVFRKKLLVILSVFAVVLCSITVKTLSKEFDSVAVSSTNWGLSFQSQGCAPIGNATSEDLAKYDAYYVGDYDKPVIYLTFDAGYESGETPKILDTLKKHNVPACFFIVSNYIETAPELVKRMVDEGHIVGNHTATHPDMSKISDFSSFEKELKCVEEQFKALTGKDLPKFYRPPQGKYNEENLKHAQSLGYKTIFWSLAYVDWYADNQPTHDEAFNKLIPRIHNGAILLLHSTSKTNAEILDELLTKYKQMGYRFASLEELI